MARLTYMEGTARLTYTASGSISAGRFVIADRSAVKQADSAGAAAIGVALTSASDGENVVVAVSGVVSVEAGGAIPLGAYITTDASGRAVVASDLSGSLTSGADSVDLSAGVTLSGGVPPEKVLGRALKAASGAGEVITIRLL